MHSIRPFDREFRALPGDEAAGDLGRAGAKRQLRSHRMLAEVKRPLALGLQHMARERDGNRAGRRAVTSALDPRPYVEQAHLAALQQRPGLARVD